MLLAGLLTGGCWEAVEPSHVEVLEVAGTPYERGLAQGRQFSSKIRSIYTQLLATSIMPYLNRELPTISDFLVEYQDPRYADGQFSYLLFLESARNLEATIPPDYLEEMRGIADGAGVDYEQVLILNTFMDTLVGFRAMTYFLRDAAAPRLTSVIFEGAEADGADNDGDGEIDEPLEAVFEPFDPDTTVSRVELPPGVRLRLCLEDPDGVNPELVRLQLAEGAWVPGDPGLALGSCGQDGTGLEVIFQPPAGFSPAAYVSLIVSAGDNLWIENPPPAKANMARDVRFGFTTAGYGKQPWQVPERSFDDGRSQPGPFGFAVRGAATADGAPLLAHHFSMLDSNTSHKHTALLVHHPEDGLVHATVGWTGSVFGFSGMNSAGLSFAANPCDTLDNPLVKQLRDRLFLAKLLSSGVPMGIAGRELLRQATTVAEAIELLRTTPQTFGWSVLLADATGDIALVEADADIAGDGTGFHVLRPDPAEPANLDAHGRLLASVGTDDLRMHVHWLKNREDYSQTLLGYELRPQRFWSSYTFRSVRSFHLLGEALTGRLGALDVAAAQELLATPELVDQRDSMNAVVLEPARALLHYAMGQVPATAGEFKTLELDAGETP